MNPIELLLKGAAIAAVACLLALALRRRSASLRHLVWLTAAIALAVLPFALAFGPKWSVHVHSQEPIAAQAIPSEPAGFGDPGGVFGVPSAAVAPSPPIQPARPVDWLFLGTVLWLGLACILICRHGLGLWGARRLVRSSFPFLTRGRVPVHLSPGLTTPATVGFFRPMVLLPVWAREWPAERLELVLAHELAHVRRSDWLWLNLGAFMAALNALNPLSWLVQERLQAESELACDDEVLAQGHDSERYADELVAIARQAKGRPIEPAMLGMAHGLRLRNRIEALGDRRRRRARASRRVRAAAFCGIVPFALVLAAGRVVQVIEPSAQAAAPAAGVGFVGSFDSYPLWRGVHTVRVLDQTGHPLAGAQIGVQFLAGFFSGFATPRHPLLTDSEGLCRFSGSDFDPKTAHGDPVGVVAHAEGFAITGVAIQQGTEDTRVTVGPGADLRVRFGDEYGGPAFGTQVSIRVLLPDRQKRAEMYLPRDPSFGFLTKTTDGQGEVTFTDLPAAWSVGLETQNPRYVSLTWRQSPAAKRIYLEPIPVPQPGSNVLEQGVALTRASAISGTVTENGRPLAGVEVQANVAGAMGGATAKSDQDGRYRIEGLNPGHYSVRIWFPPRGLTCRTYGDVQAEGPETGGIDFQMQDGGTLQGTVRYADGTVPDRTMQFFLVDPSHPDSGQVMADVKNGRFEARAWPGAYELVLPDSGSPDYPTQTLFQQGVRVEGGQTSQAHVVLPNPPGPGPATSAVSAFAPNERAFYGPARLSDGHEVRLAFLEGSGTQPWRPDGSPVSSEELARSLLFDDAGSQGPIRSMFLRVDIDEPRENLDCMVSVPHRSEWSVWQTYGDGKGRSLDMASFRVPDFVKTSDLEMGIAHGSYRVAMSEALGGPGLHARVTESGMLYLTVPEPYRSKDIRVVGYDAAGHLREPNCHAASGSFGEPKPGGDAIGVFGTDVARVELQVRDWDFVRFTGIHLRPKG